MNRKKGAQIASIEINDNDVQAYDTEGRPVKLSRRERKIFGDWKYADYIGIIEREFGTNILSPDFYVKEDGEFVFQK